MRAITVALFIVACLISYAYPRDNGQYANSDLKSWFDGLASKKGPCCSDADGNALKDNDWKSKDGKYLVRIGVDWVEVDDAALIKEPNRFGRTMVWIYYHNGEPVIRCFMPGSMI